uniref:60S ribosomal protein L7 n=1 Tax=Eimeria tenella TaxID=5802 RepID=H9BA44_EIMTE|nr:hypothetical protein [Eimeria tenella]
MTKGTEHLQEVGGARGQLRPRVEGQPLKIAETVLRKRRQDLESRAKRAEALAKAKRARKKAHRPEVKTAQYFVKKALLAMKDSKRLRVQRNRKPKQQRKPECRVYCVVRNHRRGGCRETQEALKALGLPRPYSCTLIANDENATKILRKVSPFVFYGLPSAETIRRLFVTRARLTSEEGVAPVALSDNMMVEEAFGSLGLFCVEDLVHEVVTCGPHFPQVMQRVGHFQLESLKQVEELEAKRMEYGYIRNKIDMKVAQLA